MLNQTNYKKKKTLILVESLSNDKTTNKKRNINQFTTNVKGKKFVKSDTNNYHGSEGHWLEVLMGIEPNCDNAPDNCGWEQKKDSKKITFGDWQASAYLFTSKKKRDKNGLSNEDIAPVYMKRDEFIKTFGSPNPEKNNRYSWSGSVFPKYSNTYNYAGQRMTFLDNDDLVIEYSYINDSREDKLIPLELKTNEPSIIAIWKKAKLEKHIKNKFGVNGFYICKKDTNGCYNKICFGGALDFEYFKNQVKNSIIYLDSGMYETNLRNYSQFRANQSLWYDLVTEEF